MLKLIIRICRKNQKEAAFPEVEQNPENYAGKLEFHGAAILEGGMQSGATSVGFVLKDEAGKFYHAEMSGAILEGLAASKRGAETNWKENPL